MSFSLSKFRILEWKNWIIQKRNWKTGLIELIIPVTVIILVTWIQSFIDADVADVAQDILTTYAMIWLPLAIVFCMFFSVNNTIKNVAIERESRMKETMKIMGLSSSVYWSSWFMKVFIFLTISFTIVTIFLCVPTIAGRAIFQNSNFFLIWILFVVYTSSVITLCFLISTIFKKSNTATNIGTMFFFAAVIPYNQFSQNFPSFHYSVKFLFCLPINTGLGEALSIVLRFERDDNGLRFSNFFSRGSIGFSFAEVLVVMLVALIIHLLLLVYFENVFPGNIGVAKPWHFPVSSFMKKKNEKNFNVVNEDDSHQLEFESEPSNLRAGIEIRNLSKTFGSSTVVKNLSLNIYEDQITVLLGHNGSGKTTTMNILTGMLPPSSGTAIINGFDIRTQTSEARQSLGLCHQQNVLFDDLSIKEHIQFFCKLKGMKNSSEIDLEIEKYVGNFDLNDKVNARSKTLSGGTKRKLNTINALCANSKIVICDEPSSGVDVGARRDLWDLLIKEKKGRTILLTTHHMDEAEVLGDRVAILSDGQLQTVGSTYYLKKKFGSGYRLTCVKQPGCDEQKVHRVLQTILPEINLISSELSEIVFHLPEKYLDSFQHVFKKLEDEAELLKISSFGCSFTTLEEVFLKLGTEHENEIERNGNTQTIDMNFESKENLLVTGMNLMFYQIWAMILKDLHFLRRNYYMFVWQILLSAWLIFIFMAVPIDPQEGAQINFVSFFMVTTLFYFLATYWPSIFINMKIKERVSRSKLLQFTCGANRLIFWISSFLVEFVILTTIFAILTGIIAIYQRDKFSTAEDLGTVILLLTFYSFSILPFIYLFSFMFKKHATGESIVSLAILSCAAFYAVYIVLRLTDNSVAQALASTVYWIGLFLAPFSLINSFHKYLEDAFQPEGNILNFSGSGIGFNLLINLISGVFFLSICLLIDYRVFTLITHKFESRNVQQLREPINVDDDVKAETDKVKSMSNQQINVSSLVFRKLTKFYRNVLAVNQLHLAITSSECFGLLGVNGAGKTSTFKMMVGDELISSGDAWIKGSNLKTHAEKVEKSYCPQFDALLLDLTGRETLYIFCLLRGIPRCNIPTVIDKLSLELGFQKYLDKKAKIYSGGNKRKLSTAIALLGNPSIIFLDEPTTGIDPAAKRKLWNIVNETRKSGKAVVLTSHSMEEAEALCTRLAIMVDGQFKCLGNAQHLKNRFAKGFVLIIKIVRDDDIELLANVKNQIIQKFPSAIFKERFMKLMTFHVTDESLKWSEAFANMTEIKKELLINDFTLSQMSLEQVFIFFVKHSQKISE